MTDVAPQAIRRLLTEGGLLASSAELAESESLFDSGVLDSLRLIDFVLKIETRYGISVRSDELIPDNFESISNVCAYVDAKLAGGSG